MVWILGVGRLASRDMEAALVSRSVALFGGRVARHTPFSRLTERKTIHRHSTSLTVHMVLVVARLCAAGFDFALFDPWHQVAEPGGVCYEKAMCAIFLRQLFLSLVKI